jgi:acetolactate synthase I/II/III large subunit
VTRRAPFDLRDKLDTASKTTGQGPIPETLLAVQPTLRVADAIARTLAAHGITHAFGMPGGEVVTLVDALGAAGITFVLARHETPAAIMAAGAHAATGAPGLLITTVGPGLANAVNGIADAAQERVPLLIISGCVDHAVRSRYTHQVFDHAALLRPLVKASFEVEADGAAAVVARALRLACAEPMGPVHIDLSPGTAALPASGHAEIAPVRTVRPSVLNGGAVGEVQALLAGARRPLVIGGFEAVRSGAGAVLTALTERLGAPIITTYKAKGLVSEFLPQAMGAAGLSPRADGELLALTKAADVVLLAGYDPIEMRTSWLEPFAQDAMVIDISRHPTDHGMHQTSLHLLCDVRQIAGALLEGLEAQPSWTGGEPHAARERLRMLFAPPKDWGPHAIADGIEAALPDTATVTIDSGAHRILLSQRMRMARPGALLQSAGLCTMGAAVPLAIGMAAARPAAPVIAVVGDGGFEMCMGELGTIRDHGLPIVVIVLQDNSLALIELKQSQAGLAEAGVRLGATRYEAVAEAFGGQGVRVDSRTAFNIELAAALARSVFTVIVCDIEASDYANRI